MIKQPFEVKKKLLSKRCVTSLNVHKILNTNSEEEFKEKAGKVKDKAVEN